MLWTLLLGLAHADGPAAVLAVGTRPAAEPPTDDATTDGPAPEAPSTAPPTPPPEARPDSWLRSLQDCLADKRPEGFHVIDRRAPGATASSLAARLPNWAALAPTYVVLRLSEPPDPAALGLLLTGFEALKPPPPTLLFLPPPISQDPSPTPPIWAPVVAEHPGVTVVVDGEWHLTEQGNARVGARICDAILALSKTTP